MIILKNDQMTKDEQIEFLVSALKEIAEDYYPWHGEDAIIMSNLAEETIAFWSKHTNRKE